MKISVPYTLVIKYHFNQTTKSNPPKIQIPVDNKDWNNIPKDNSIQWKIIPDSNEIEKVLIKQNIAHLSQTERTLFTVLMIIYLIGKDGCLPGAATILNESYNPSEDKFSPLQIAYFKNL